MQGIYVADNTPGFFDKKIGGIPLGIPSLGS